jgi:NAD(P)-dependent dehydrogenase (short-subunit alcohol dehydrogenase family)
MEVKGCTAVVAGGASGLGEATVRSLVNDGAKVAIFDFDETRGSQIAAEKGRFPSKNLIGSYRLIWWGP